MLQFGQIRKMSGYVQCLHRPFQVIGTALECAANAFDAFMRIEAAKSFVPVGRAVCDTFQLHFGTAVLARTRVVLGN